MITALDIARFICNMGPRLTVIVCIDLENLKRLLLMLKTSRAY